MLLRTRHPACHFLHACLSFAALCAVSTTGAATHYVATDGSDSNPGTQSQPYVTIGKALSAVAAGDIISIGAGTYAESLSTSVDGSSTSTISVIGAGAGRTKITGRFTIQNSYYLIKGITVSPNYISIEHASHVRVDSCEFLRGVFGVNMSYASDCTIANCEFHHPQGNGMINLAGNNELIENNYFHDSNGWDAMRANGTVDCVIRNNRFERIVAAGGDYSATSSTNHQIDKGIKTFTIPAGRAFSVYDQVRATSSGGTMIGSVNSYDGTSLAVSVSSITGTGTYSNWSIELEAGAEGNHADIIQTFGPNGRSYNILFEANRIQDCTSQFGMHSPYNNPDYRDWTIRNNLFVNSRIDCHVYAPGFKFYNNTIYNAEWSTGFRGASTDKFGNGVPIAVYNNIFCRVGTSEGGGAYSGAIADYNLITDRDDSAKTGYSELHGINGGYSPDQIFVNPSAGDFRLKASSPAIGTGTDLSSTGFSTDISHIARSGLWDMGAIAYGTAISGDSPVPAAPSALATTAN